MTFLHHHMGLQTPYLSGVYRDCIIKKTKPKVKATNYTTWSIMIYKGSNY